MLDLEDVLENYIDHNKLYSVEGTKGLINLCKIAGALGYKDPLCGGQISTGAYTGNLLAMLEDNPIMIEAILQCIEDNMSEEWAENLGVSEEDEEDEDE